MSARESRPGLAPEAARNCLASDTKDTRRPQIVGRLTIDLRRLDAEGIRRRLGELAAAPAGAHVVLLVPSGSVPPWLTIEAALSECRAGTVTADSSDVTTATVWLAALQGQPDPWGLIR